MAYAHIEWRALVRHAAASFMLVVVANVIIQLADMINCLIGSVVEFICSVITGGIICSYGRAPKPLALLPTARSVLGAG